MSETRSPSGAALFLNLSLAAAFIALAAAIIWLTTRTFLLVTEMPRLPWLEEEGRLAFDYALSGFGAAALTFLGIAAVYISVRELRRRLGGGRVSPFMSRLDGISADLFLFGSFLTTGTAALNLLIVTIVLIVGVVRTQTVPEGFPDPEPGRFTADLSAGGLSLVCFLVFAGIHWQWLRTRRVLMRNLVDAGFESFVSKRYLLSREGGKLVSLISVVSVLGVAVGVMALIVVQGVMAGFDQTLRSKFMGIYAHIEYKVDTRMGLDGEMPRDFFEPMIEQFRTVDWVQGASPLMTYETMVQAQRGISNRRHGVLIRGVEPERENAVTDFDDFVFRGRNDPGKKEAVIGKVLAQRLGVGIGGEFIAYGKTIQTANRRQTRTLPLKVVGIFDSGIYEVDERFIITNLSTVQSLLVTGDVADSIQVRVENPDVAEIYGMQLLREFTPEGIGFLTWKDRNRNFFEALQVEKISMFIILNLIVLVAALNIIGTLVMTVIQKTRDIGILKSMGAPPRSILTIFLLHGLFIGMIGTALGTVWGLRLCWFVREDIERIFKLPEGVYGLDKLPVLIDPFEIFIMVATAMIICISASIIPAWQAARLNPVEALRHE